MQRDGVFRGVPAAVTRDAWWLDPATPGAGGPNVPDGGPVRASGAAGLPRVVGLVLLVALADTLFWGHPRGLSLAVFAGAVFWVATLDIAMRDRWRPAVLLMVGAAPVVEHVQALSIAFLIAATAGTLVWARLPAGGLDGAVAAVFRLLRRVPFGGLAALFGAVRGAVPGTMPGAGHALAGPGRRLRALLRDWAFPAGGTLVFGTLLVDANPVLARLVRIEIDVAGAVERALFWFGVGLLIWPLVDRAPARPEPVPPPRPPCRLGFGVNAGSTLRALVVFNLLIGVQSVLDLSILVGGAALPDGMSYAEYAHRGAYPLLATALLAGAFAMAAQPYLDERAAIRPLMLVWLGQNVALCLSALLRLDLYVEAYGLTYLRIHAMIWMALVAVGLALVAWKVWQRRSNRWLLLGSTGLGGAVLYACAFVNFAAIIAATNLSGDRPHDWEYLCALDRTAARAFREGTAGDPALARTAALQGCAFDARAIEGWRDFGFRDWRVAR